jgi:hypothetical protein
MPGQKLSKKFAKFMSGKFSFSDKLVLGCLLAVVLLFVSWQLDWLGFLRPLFFLVWLGLSAVLAQSIWQKIFDIEKSLAFIISVFASLLMFGLFGNLFVSWLVFGDLEICLIMILITIFCYLSPSRYGCQTEPSNHLDISRNDGRKNFWFYYAAFGAAIIIAWLIIYLSQTGSYLISPWSVLGIGFLVAVFFAGVAVFFLVISGDKFVRSLILIVLLSLCAHSYLLVYQSGFGGDHWRHLGSEYRLLNYSQPFMQSSLDGWNRQQEVLGIDLPKNLVNASQLSYGFSWFFSASASRISGVDVFYLDKFLGLIFWSLFLPFIFVVVARQIGVNQKFCLLAASLPLAFYPLQYYGSQTLAVGYGALNFLFLLALWLSYYRRPDKKTAILILIFSVLAYFNYSLVLLLALFLAVLFSALRWQKFTKVGLAFLGVILFALEVFFGFGHLKLLLVREVVVNLIKNNILYFNTGHFLPRDFSLAPFVYLLLAAIFWCLIIIFIYRALKGQNLPLKFLSWLSILFLTNYIFSSIFLVGTKIISGRLNVFLAMILVLIFAWGLNIFFSSLKSDKFLLPLAIILSLILVLTYASGPVLNAAVTSDDVAAARYLTQTMAGDFSHYCVLADTWPLLAVEAFSYREIAAGNFPIYTNHQQPERVDLFSKIKNQPTSEVLLEAKNISGQKNCFLLLNKKQTVTEVIGWLQDNLGAPKIFGDNLIWQF